MYNEERKTRYLKTCGPSEPVIASILGRFTPYEEAEDKDLCEFPLEVLQPIVNTKFGGRTKSVAMTVSYIRGYVQWCAEEHYPTSDAVYSLSVDLTEKTRQTMFASPAHLARMLDKGFAPLEEEMVDCLYRCHLWMGFAGMKDRETSEVKISDIHFDTMTIEHKGKTYDIYRESLPAFRMACTATQFRYKNPRYDPIYRDRFPGDNLLRGIRSDKIAIRTLRVVTAQAFEKAEVKTSYEKIRMSGMFYRAYELERCGDSVSFDDYVVERMKAYNFSEGEEKKQRQSALAIEREMKRDYSVWKAAFVK